MGYIGDKDFDSLEDEIKFYIDAFPHILKRVDNITLKEMQSLLRYDLFLLSVFTLSASVGYPTDKDLLRVSKIIGWKYEGIKDYFTPEYYQHVLRENMFKSSELMIVFNTTWLIVKYENQFHREKPYEEGECTLSFMYLNLLKRITEYLIGSSPRKVTTKQLLGVSILIQAQTNYIMSNLEILDLCRGSSAEYAITPQGRIQKKSKYEKAVKEKINCMKEAIKVSKKEAKERRKQEREKQKREELEELYWKTEELRLEHEREEEEEREQERIWMEEEEEKRRKEQEEQDRRIREMEDIMAYDDMLRYGHYI